MTIAPGQTSRRIAWGRRILAAWVIVLLTCSPAANGIYRYADKQGRIHITNIDPNQSKKPTGGKATAELPLIRPAAGPVPDSPHQQFRSKDTDDKEILRFKDNQGVIHITNRQSKTSPAPAPVAPTPRSPLQRISFSADTLGTATTDSASPQAVLRAARKICSYRDSQGVLHIKSKNPVRLAAMSRLSPQLILRQVRAAVTNMTNPGLAGANSASIAPAGLTGADSGTRVAAFRDKRGVIHINSVASGTCTAAPRGPWPVKPASGSQYEAIITEAARHYQLPVSLIQALIEVESNFSPGAVSPKGAQGLMQLMPATAAFLGVKNPFCPRENIHGGCRYLRLLLDLFHNSLPLALAAYNAGYQRVIEAGYKVPAITETQKFVTQVLGRYMTYLKRRSWPWSIGGI